MRSTLTLLLLIGLLMPVFGQTPVSSRVFIQLDAENTIQELASLGLDVEHGNFAPQKHFIGDFSKVEIHQIAQAGFNYEILIEDVTTYYVEQLAAQELSQDRNQDCENPDLVLYDYPTPENFDLGTMAGYFTYQEMLENLDSMRMKYPNLITARTEVPGIITHDGNPIYWIRISDNPDQDESEPEVLYTALHHAREPGSLSQMIFYMWYLLEHYEDDPEVQYLVEQTEMYFVPCVNPDGYLYNEFTNPDGGGFWRKNRRDNLDGSFGVDLNRNYDYGWGYDDSGSSPNTNAVTYRGPEPFSEPETQALRDLCNDHEFQIALNYHTYGNLLIYPWGYLDTLPLEADIFVGMAEGLNRENSFFAGTASQTVGYTVNGVSDDWMYGSLSKPPIYSFTPEVGPGNFGFWPPIEFIDILCKSTLLQNFTAAHMLLVYGIAVDESPELFLEFESAIDYNLTRYGLMEGDLTVSLTALSSNVAAILDGPQSYNLNYGESISSSFQFEVAPDITQGEELVFLLSVDNGTFIQSDTLRKIFLAGESSSVFISDGTDFDDWVSNGNWGLSTSNFYSAPTAITDSPGEEYFNNQINETRSPVIDLTDLENADLTFWATWDIENDYDYVVVEAVLQSTGEAIPLCGLYTNPGVGFFQPEGMPLFDGTQPDWVQEIICLDDFVGQEIRIAFTLHSDGGVTEDGFYFDDLEVMTVMEDTTTTGIATQLISESQLLVFPNPSQDFVWVQLSDEYAGNSVDMVVYDLMGRRMVQQSFMGPKHRMSLSDWPGGMYFIEVRQSGNLIGTAKFQK